MAEETKFTEDEMKTIQSIQDSYFEVQNDFGKLNLAKIKLEQQFDDLDVADNDLTKKFIDIQEEEKKFLNDITKKYGEGSLNSETGVFTPNKS
ncbi:MAG: hypothetical protein H8D94_01160 [Candidatus Pelagibacter sp.]|nr:hypothetical protein [Candidatus Pelagibacter sp.]